MMAVQGPVNKLETHLHGGQWADLKGREFNENTLQIEENLLNETGKWQVVGLWSGYSKIQHLGTLTSLNWRV